MKLFGRNRSYEIAAACDNCNQKVLLKIPKGVLIKQHLDNKKGLCPNCGCPISYEEK